MALPFSCNSNTVVISCLSFNTNRWETIHHHIYYCITITFSFHFSFLVPFLILNPQHASFCPLCFSWIVSYMLPFQAFQYLVCVSYIWLNLLFRHSARGVCVCLCLSAANKTGRVYSAHLLEVLFDP